MRLFRVLITAAMAHWLCMAQAFQHLSTTDDGSVLYFSTPDRLIGTNQSFHSKIFRWDAANGFQLVADVPDTGKFDGCTYPNFFQLDSPQISGDGKVLAYTGSRPTQNGKYCTFSEPHQGIVQQNGQARTFIGSIAISPDGRYAITTPTDALTNSYHFVTDLTSGPANIVAGAFNGDPWRITDEGAVLTPEPSALVLTDRSGGTRVWQTKMAVSDAIVDRAGRTLVYLTAIGPNNPGAISTIDVGTGAEKQIFTGFAPGNLNLSADGSKLLFTNVSSSNSGNQLFLMSIDGTGERQIGTASVADAILSGDGTVIYANATDGRLLRVDVASGAATELAPETPFITTAYRAYMQTTIAAVGSVVLLYDPGLNGVKQVTFCGQPVALLNHTLALQVPWSLPDQTCEAIVQTASPFESGISLTVQQYDPRFVTDGQGNAILAHADFSGPVGAIAPAHPGDIVVAYMTGLGPVDASGLLTKPGFHCSFENTQANVLYTGLAPGLTGFYQVNLQVPDMAKNSGTLVCGWDISTQAVAGFSLGSN